MKLLWFCLDYDHFEWSFDYIKHKSFDSLLLLFLHRQGYLFRSIYIKINKIEHWSYIRILILNIVRKSLTFIHWYLFIHIDWYWSTPKCETIDTLILLRIVLIQIHDTLILTSSSRKPCMAVPVPVRTSLNSPFYEGFFWLTFPRSGKD